MQQKWTTIWDYELPILDLDTVQVGQIANIWYWHCWAFIQLHQPKKTLRARYQTNNQKSQATTQTLEMYADTNTLPYRELCALAQHTVLFPNGLGNWWYISNIASRHLTPWMFLTSREGNPVAFKNRANTLPRSSAQCIHIAAAGEDSAPECYSVCLTRKALREAKGCPYKFTQAKRSTLYWEKKKRGPAHVREGPPLHRRPIWSVGFSSALQALLFTVKHDPKQQQLQCGFSSGLLGIKQRALLVATS